jgi:ribosome-binding factor A
MPMSQRTDRLDELLRQEIGAMLEREIADPRMGFATVTQVETDPDLRHARVWVSIIGGTAERSATLVALDHAMVFIRRELGTRLRLKRIPDLHVRLDDSIERGTRILQVIDAIETGGLPGDPPAGESLPTPSRGAAPGGAGVDVGDVGTVEPAAPDPREGFGAAAAEYAASLAASLAARRDARRPGRTGSRADPRGARPGPRDTRADPRAGRPDRRLDGGPRRGQGGGR